jgi:hypothetical protein
VRKEEGRLSGSSLLIGSDRSDPRADVSHQVSVNPVDNAGIDISHHEQSWELYITFTDLVFELHQFLENKNLFIKSENIFAHCIVLIL